MTESASGSDMELGLAMVFGALGVVGALVMYVAATGGDQVLSGWGFAGAMLAGGILIAALHLFE